MLQETKRDLISCARKLAKPYEKYSIDELADAYCEALDTNNSALKDIYISALMLRFWKNIISLSKANTAPSFDLNDFFSWVYESIEYLCEPGRRAWQDKSKNLNAKQCIEKRIVTVSKQHYKYMTMDKRKAANASISFETPLCGDCGSDTARTLEDVLEAEDHIDSITADAGVLTLIQNYIDRNKIVEAILLDNIAFNDVQKSYKRMIKTENAEGETFRYTEHSSEFWPYKLIQMVSKLPSTYKASFMKRYNISEDKLTTVLNVIDSVPNQRLYKYLRETIKELRYSYSY